MDKLTEILALMQDQMERQESMLMLMQKQQKDTSESFLRALEMMEARMNGANPAAVKYSIFDSLCRRIDKFNFDAENGRTFDIWFKRFKDVFDNDCTELSEQEKTRLLVSRLDEDCHQLFCGSIAPRSPSELSWDEAVATMDRLFGSAKTLFRRRFECFKIMYDHQDFNSYETLVRTRCSDAKFDSISFDGLQCLVYVAGFQGAEFADYRTRLLRKLDQGNNITIKDLTAECQLIKSYKEDARMLENTANPNIAINCVGRKRKRRNFNLKQKPRSRKEFNALRNPRSGKQESLPPSRPQTRRNSARSCQIKSIEDALRKDAQPHLEVEVNGRPLKLLLDTGVMITLISESSWKKLGRPQLQKFNTIVNAANGTRIPTKGYILANFVLRSSDGRQHRGQGCCYVTEKLDIFGWEWIQKIPELVEPLQKYISGVTIVADPAASCREEIVAKLKINYADVFRAGLGRCTKTKATLQLKPDAHPIFKKKRPVPFAYVAALDEEIDRLLAEQVLSPVDYSAWAAPIVVVKKSNGTLRLCADFSTGLNDALMLHQHPLPTPDDVFTKLNGGTTFTQIDFADAYLQIEVDDEAKELLTINTHRGLLRYNRLPFGVKSAPGIFQQIIDSMICGLEGCAAYLDDVIVTGRNIEEHVANLEALFKRISDYGFRVRVDKCNFLMPQLRYLGNIIDSTGRRPDPAKIEVIRKMPNPTDIGQVRSFLGMLNYYGHFISEMRQLRAPLDDLLRKNAPFKWSAECQDAFQRAKDVLASDLLLTHYDPSKEIVIAADASEYGLGAVISHRLSDGTEKAIHHASRSLTAAERNYGQVEKEALAITFALRKFHRYIYGRHFKLLTDHKPLLAIFGSKKGVPVYTANRLQRWALIVKNYDFTIEYRHTTNFGQADALSRLIAEQSTKEEDVVIAAIEKDASTIFVNAVSSLPVDARKIAEETSKDPNLKEVLHFVRSGEWPKKSDVAKRFNSLKESLSTQNGCLLIGDRIVIPDTLRKAVLSELHDGHPGMTRMKMLARNYVYWTNINDDIETFVRTCRRCQETAKNPVKTTLHSWPIEDKPWNRIHADFAGPINGKMYFVIVDAYSKWPEIVEMSSVTTSCTIRELRRLFAQFGNPQTLVTDNGTQFTSAEFDDFCTKNGIRHIKSPPFHPQSNGQAERFVDTFKRNFKKMKESSSPTEALQNFLQTYRRTPCPSAPGGQSPAELFLGRQIRTRLNLLKPCDITNSNKRDQKMEAQYNRHHGAKDKQFNIGDFVWAKDYRSGWPKQTPGQVLQRHGDRHYDIAVNGEIWKRHANQLRLRVNSDEHTPVPTTELAELQLLPMSAPANVTEEIEKKQSTIAGGPQLTPAMDSITRTTPFGTQEIDGQRPTRSRRAPKRLMVDPKKKTYA
uniref:RNA-directed DNA polymerase n=1 Tax=Haemonchus contortus TaxID=6289 RepID=A0A7I4YY53_HAECO